MKVSEIWGSRNPHWLHIVGIGTYHEYCHYPVYKHLLDDFFPLSRNQLDANIAVLNELLKLCKD